jgi:FixJ family two-component response regulator
MHSAPRLAAPIVIVVDDDLAVLGSLKFTFEVEGFVVYAYGSAEALLDAGAPPRRACLVLDHQLPGINGLELLNHLRERGHELPAVLITTPNAETNRRAALAGVSIIEKPLFGEALVDKVRALIDAPASGQD